MSEIRANSEVRSGVRNLLEGQQLPFSEVRQSAFLGHVMNPRTNLFRLVNGIMDEGWFGNPKHRKLWRLIQLVYKYRANVGSVPTAAELRGEIGRVSKDAAEQAQIATAIDTCLRNAEDIRDDLLKAEIETWMHAKVLMAAMKKANELYNKEDFKAAQQILLDSQKSYNHTMLVLTDEAPESIVEELVEGMSPKQVVPFGISSMDEFLYPDNPQGSLCKGDQTVLIAPINIGKSTTMSTVSIHNIMADNLVCYTACEGNKYGLRLKFIRAYFTMMTPAEFMKAFVRLNAKKPRSVPVVENPEKVAKYIVQLGELAARTPAKIIEFLGNKGQNPEDLALHRVATWLIEYLFTRLTFLYLVKPNLSFEEVQVALERANVNCIDRNEGRAFDLVCIDYPGTLTVEMARQGRFEQRQITQKVYQSFEALAGQHQWHSLVAIQTNRAGSKINAGVDDKGNYRKNPSRFLMNEDVSETFGALMGAATVITINRSPEDQMKNWVTFVVTKSRGSGVHFAVTCISNFAQGISHWHEYGSRGYYGTHAEKFILDTYLKPKENGILTQDQMLVAEHKELNAIEKTMGTQGLTTDFDPAKC